MNELFRIANDHEELALSGDATAIARRNTWPAARSYAASNGRGRRDVSTYTPRHANAAVSVDTDRDFVRF